MRFLSLFSNKLSTLRISHCLTFSELALILNQNNTSVIKKWVAEKNWPSTEVLLSISRIFGVSIDWLLSNIDHPYNEDFILSLENELITSQVCFGDNRISLFNPFSFPECYYNPELRKETYSLPVRANLVFLMTHEAMYQAYAYKHTLSSSEPLITTLKINLFNNYNDKKIWSEAESRHKHYLSIFLQLIYNGKEATPIFNIID